jgi:hypothetical protein
MNCGVKKISAMTQQKIDKGKYSNKTEAAASPFPSGIAGDKCL